MPDIKERIVDGFLHEPAVDRVRRMFSHELTDWTELDTIVVLGASMKENRR